MFRHMPGSYASAERLLARRVPPVQHQRVSVGVVEEGQVADARVDRLAGELDALRLEGCACSGDVGDAQREAAEAGGERLTLACGIEDVERHLAGAELH